MSKLMLLVLVFCVLLFSIPQKANAENYTINDTQFLANLTQIYNTFFNKTCPTLSVQPVRIPLNFYRDDNQTRINITNLTIILQGKPNTTDKATIWVNISTYPPIQPTVETEFLSKIVYNTQRVINDLNAKLRVNEEYIRNEDVDCEREKGVIAVELAIDFDKRVRVYDERFNSIISARNSYQNESTLWMLLFFGTWFFVVVFAGYLYLQDSGSLFKKEKVEKIK